MKRRTRLVATVLAMLSSAALVGVGMMSFHDKTATARPVVPPFDIFWCDSNDDCVVADRIGCCECSAGGGQGAVTRWHTDDLRQFLKSACRPAPVCVQIDLCRNDLKPVCEDRRCQLVVDSGAAGTKDPKP